MSNQTLTKLNSEWALWFHKCDDNDWDFSSYTSLGTFDCIEDYSIIMNAFEPGHVENSMLKDMRNSNTKLKRWVIIMFQKGTKKKDSYLV